MRLIEPPLEEFSKLRQPLTQGERLVFDFFHRHLEPRWEIYIQPHFNGLRPDFILMHPNIGIAVFEVKDWNLDTMKFFGKRTSEKTVELWSKKDGHKFSYEDNNPFTKIIRYKEEIYNVYCPRLPKNKGFAAITGGVIFPFADSDRVHTMQRAFLSKNQEKYASKYWPVSGRQELARNDINKVFPYGKLSGSQIMRPEFANDLRGWLIEPDFAREQRKSLPLDSRQRKLAESRSVSGYRRIKGPAGSGKSLVLAARASQLISENKSVLIVTFNITLWHYLRDLVVRGGVWREYKENIIFKHFHGWCRDICREAGFEQRYKELAMNEDNDEFFNIKLPALANEAAMKPDTSKYDAILVDEGQDFHLHWWNALRNSLKPNGEMLLVADITQDIYGTARRWTDEAMTGAGFTGNWVRIEGSYRLSQNIKKASRNFATMFLPSELIDLPDEVQENLDIEPCILKWIQCEPEASRRQCVDAICALMHETGKAGLANSDIVFICDTIDFGRKVIDELGTLGISTIDTFEKDKSEGKRKKLAFFMGGASIKGTTLHSFKGWETRLLVIHFGQDIGRGGFASVYAALTRLKRSSEGSWLTVVCSAHQLAKYGRTWTDHIDITKFGALNDT